MVGLLDLWGSGGFMALLALISLRGFLSHRWAQMNTDAKEQCGTKAGLQSSIFHLPSSPALGSGTLGADIARSALNF